MPRQTDRRGPENWRRRPVEELHQCEVAMSLPRFVIAILIVIVAFAGPSAFREQSAGNEFNDSHFHLTNYIQEGTDIRDFLDIMGTSVGRVALFGIPLQQQWSYRIPATTPRRITCRPTRRSTTTPSPTRASRWLQVAVAGAAGALRSDDHRVQPRRHVRRGSHSPRAARRSPGCSPASESSRSTRNSSRLRSPAKPPASRSGARPRPRVRRGGRPGRDPAQRHRHPVREGRRRAGVSVADEGVACAASEGDDHLGAHRARPHRPSRPGVAKLVQRPPIRSSSSRPC